MKDLPLNALRAFAAIYESGGVRPAARSLEVSHSAVIRHLRELEGWLETELVKHEEGRRRLIFTPAGEQLGRDCLKCLAGMNDSVAALIERKSGNTVTIATTPSIATRWLLPLLPRINEDHPAIEISVVADQKIASPDDQGADFSIRMGKGPWRGLECTPLMDDSLFPVVGREFWENHGPQISLANHTLLHDRDPQAGWSQWQSQIDQEIPNIAKGPRFGSSDLVLRAAAQNQGIALARGQLALQDLETGNLVRPFGANSIQLKNAYWIVHSSSKHHKSAVHLVMKRLHHYASSLTSP